MKQVSFWVLYIYNFICQHWLQKQKSSLTKKLSFVWKSEGVMYNEIGEGEKDEMTSTEQDESGGDWSGKWGWRKRRKFVPMMGES